MNTTQKYLKYNEIYLEFRHIFKDLFRKVKMQPWNNLKQSWLEYKVC